MNTPCLTAAQLDSFVQGNFDDVATQALESHVDECDDCRQGLGAIVRGKADVAMLGRYRLEGILGAGGMGIVYRGFDPELRRPVAIKVVRPGADETLASLRARLGREAESMARLSHRNVCVVYDVGTDDNELWVAMELIDGQSLRPWMASRPSRDEVLRVMSEVAAGLGAAHAVGMCHRDIKPDNILVERSGRAVLTDFGLARSFDAATGQRSTAIAGTLAYLAPEILEGHVPNPRSDQYAFAVTLHEALVGNRPRPRGVADQSLPTPLRRAIGQALAEDPTARFATMEALSRALHEASVPSRGRWLLGAAAVGVLATAAAATVAIVATRDGETVPVPTAPVVVMIPLAPELSPAGIPEPLAPLVLSGEPDTASAKEPVQEAASPPMPIVVAPRVTPTPSAPAPLIPLGPPTPTSPMPTVSPATTNYPPGYELLPMPANPTSVDALAVWRADRAAANKLYGKSRLLLLTADLVLPNGRVNVTRQGAMVQSMFVAASWSKSDTPGDFPCGIGRQVLRGSATQIGLTASACSRPVPWPTCTVKQIWQRAIANGTPANVPVNIRYSQVNTNGTAGWSVYRSSEQRWTEYDDNCSGISDGDSDTAKADTIDDTLPVSMP